MLEKLRYIIQDVGAAKDLNQALGIIVRWVKAELEVDICSVYLKDPIAKDFILMATEGLSKASVGYIRLAPGEGLVGRVGAQREPLLLHNASSHPDYKYFPIAGEKEFDSFLGLPIIQYSNVIGVLVIQHRTNREFNDDDMAVLVTITAQLAGVIYQATHSDQISLSIPHHFEHDTCIEGVSGAPGVGIGKVVLPSVYDNLETIPDRKTDNPENEFKRFNQALVKVEEEFRVGQKRMSDLLPREAQALFDVYSLLLADHSLSDAVKEHIDQGLWAPTALRKTIHNFAHQFETMDDPYLRGRAEDIRAIGQRIVYYLQTDKRKAIDYPNNTILAGDEVSLARIADVPAEKLKGILCQRGSSMSHAAIIANSLGIPAVMGLEDLPLTWLHGETVIADGYQGRVFIAPNVTVIAEFKRLIREEQQLTTELSTLQDKPSTTTDGFNLPLYSNIGALSEFQMTSVPGSDGIGLYRTEFTFMLRNSFPSEEEQFQRYSETLASNRPNPVNIRILDIGADKPLPYFKIEEENSFLGWRGIRVMLDHPEILLTQLRAMLRAHHENGNLQIVLPMVTYLSEIHQTIEFLKSAQKSLLEKGINVDIPPLGVMIEVPALIYQIEKMKGLVEFLSVGSNDLAQYILAVDRNNPKVSNLFESLHPAVLETLQIIQRKAESVGIPVTVCGEIAGDPAVALLLLGMGMNGLSMNSASIPRVKWVIRSFSRAEAKNLLEIALTMDNGRAIRNMLNEAITAKGMGGIVRAGRI